MSKPRFFTLAGMILFAALFRIIPHPWNFTPIGAIALFGGVHFEQKLHAYLVPFIALVLSDLVIGLYQGLPVVYLAFAGIVFMGRMIRGKKTVPSIALAAFAGSIWFFFVTNTFIHWLLDSLYPKTMAGLFTCYTAAIPFFRNSILGDAFFTTLLFGGLWLLERSFPGLQAQNSEKQEPA